jgi:predicted metalloenzyme YecM
VAERIRCDVDAARNETVALERHAKASSEDVWNGRPISKIVLAEPLDVLDATPVSLIELIPPVHQRVYRMGLEHRESSSVRRSTTSPASTERPWAPQRLVTSTGPSPLPR